ncbi:hypothetical protein FACS189490_02320 [Clostridia bacterium]|nr:hypothetical protein FACS189490_02320 [Clostridia bacterium]
MPFMFPGGANQGPPVGGCDYVEEAVFSETVNGINEAISNVSANVDSVIADIDAVSEDVGTVSANVTDLTAYVGYVPADVWGLEADFQNSVFTRLGASVGKNGGADFDNVECFGGRRRCNVSDDGTINAYYGDETYVEDGSNGQVMVYQPKFYYKVVPLKTEKIVGGKGFHLRKARYYVSPTYKEGFKLHPAFVKNGAEVNYALIGAYEGSVYDVSEAAYISDDAQVADFIVGTGDKLSSIANAKPANGKSQSFVRRNCGVLAENRGAGWSQEYAAVIAADQLLMVVEYGTFNMQDAIGLGYVNDPSGGSNNYSMITGSTSGFGNASGMADGDNGMASVSYRGEENPWGNIFKYVDGINVYRNELYVTDHGFTEDTADLPYVNAGVTIAKTTGYISAFAYNEPFDWLFFASEVLGNTSVPVGDRHTASAQNDSFAAIRYGGRWSGGLTDGPFFYLADITNTTQNVGQNGRLVYVPTA